MEAIELDYRGGGRIGLVGDSSSMRLVRRDIARLARLRAPVLLTGETGTGKELAARALHDCSPRASGPFVAVNCGALTATLAEDALFGHERGAFTGAATVHRGAFERAGSGTLFLDEIGELGAHQQAALLRVLDDRRVTRIGGEAAAAVDFRLVAATNRDLPQMMAQERFRLDLFHRISALRIELPPLRDRPGDIEQLARLFLEAMADDVGARELDPEALGELGEHSWPGNARELRNALYRAAALSSHHMLGRADLQLERPARPPRPTRFRLEQVPDGRLEEIVTEHGGNVAAAARSLGVPRTTVRDRLRRIRACHPDPEGGLRAV
jgi:DNA-binding NtrC family response regulator